VLLVAVGSRIRPDRGQPTRRQRRPAATAPAARGTWELTLARQGVNPEAMESRDVFGFAFSFAIGLLLLAFTPWSGPWWFGLILAISIAGVSLINIALRRFKVAPDLNIPLIVSAIITMLVIASFAMWGFWLFRTDESQFARFHIVSTEVAFSRQNPNQLIANIYFQNDAGDADVVVYGATGLATQPADQAAIDQLRKAVADLVKEGNGIHFKIISKELNGLLLRVLSCPLTKWKNITGGSLLFTSLPPC
jgi:hypothetical protein